MAVSARITFGKKKGIATLGNDGIIEVDWEGKTPITFGRMVRDVVEPTVDDIHSFLLAPASVELLTDDPIEQDHAVSLAQQLNIIWQQARRAGIATRFESNQFRFTPEVPEEQEHLTNPVLSDLVDSDEEIEQVT